MVDVVLEGTVDLSKDDDSIVEIAASGKEVIVDEVVRGREEKGLGEEIGDVDVKVDDGVDANELVNEDVDVDCGLEGTALEVVVVVDVVRSDGSCVGPLPSVKFGDGATATMVIQLVESICRLVIVIL